MALLIELLLYQLTFSHFFTLPILSPIPLGQSESGCVGLSCQLGLNHDSLTEVIHSKDILVLIIIMIITTLIVVTCTKMQ